jgi:uncharacterized protein with HEPN domain
MQHETKKYLDDMAKAAELIAQFTAGKTLADYMKDSMLRAAVERQFEIVGEALVQLAKCDPALAARIGEHQRIIAFRNILIHGYNCGRPPRLGCRRKQACRFAPGRLRIAQRAVKGADVRAAPPASLGDATLPCRGG